MKSNSDPAHSRRPAKLRVLNGSAIVDPGESAASPARLRLAAENPRCAGAVRDLESHVPREWWRSIFDSLYLKTDGDVFENEQNTQADIDTLIAAAGLIPDDRILDLCCGQGRHTIALARRGFLDVTGIDQSAYLIGLARQRARQAELDVTFREGDARHCAANGGVFDCVAILGNSFGYFDRPEDDIALLRAARGHLHAGGRLALDLVDGAWLSLNFTPQSWEWIDSHLLVCRQRSLAKSGDRLITRELILDAEHGAIADRFFAERLYSHDAIAALLEAAGFTDIGFHDTIQAKSEGGVDLGMMAHRHLVTAHARSGGARARSRKLCDVAVVLGDPRLPDPVKPGGKFGANDGQTVARLRAALTELPDYRFRFLDNHAALQPALRAAQPDLVLNLCDEGFGNDAMREAHIPALLDMLGLPYTGAGAACLTTCYDKSVVRAIAAALGIPVPAEILVNSGDAPGAIALLPALIKPCLGDNSIGIDDRSVVHTPAAAADALRRLQTLMPGRPLLVQEYLSGGEYSVGLIGNPGQPFEVLPVLHVDYSALDPALPPILAYASKWDPDSAYARQIGYTRAVLPADVERLLARRSMRLFQRLGCRDYARFDFRADAQGEIKLLEVNPNPGWCWDGKLNLMAGFAGIDYAQLLRLILEAARRRLDLAALSRAS